MMARQSNGRPCIAIIAMVLAMLTLRSHGAAEPNCRLFPHSWECLTPQQREEMERFKASEAARFRKLREQDEAERDARLAREAQLKIDLQKALEEGERRAAEEKRRRDEAARKAAAAAKAAEEDRRARIAFGPFADAQKRALVDRMPFVGADAETLVTLGPGRPDDVRTSVSGLGTVQTWTYRSRGMLVTLVDGRVASFSY